MSSSVSSRAGSVLNSVVDMAMQSFREELAAPVQRAGELSTGEDWGNFYAREHCAGTMANCPRRLLK
jgi:hypothetical protein